MIDVVERANTALDSAPDSRFATEARTLIPELVLEVEQWRDNYRRVLKAMLGNARVIGQLRDECGLSVEYVDSLVTAATADAFAAYHPCAAVSGEAEALTYGAVIGERKRTAP